jgi:two-component system, NtrC family, sensor kinase
MIDYNGENVINDFTSTIDSTPELLLSAWDFFSDGICILSENKTILKVNKSFCNIFNTSPEQIIHKNLIDAFSGRNDCNLDLKKIINLNGSESISFHSAIACSGKRIIIQSTVNKFRVSDNNLFYFWSVRDKSDYMKMKEALKAENEDLKITIKSIGDGVITTGSSGQVLRMNPEAERLTGWKQSIAQGKNFNEIVQTINEKSAEEFEFPLKKILIEGEKVQFSNNTILVSRTSIKTPIAYTGSPILNYSGNVKGAAIILRDETDNHLKKKLIQESEERFSCVFHSGLAGITLSSFETGLFIDVNERFLEFTGYTRDEVIGSSSIQLGLWNESETRADFIELLTEYKKVKEIDFEFRTKSGEIRSGQISAELVKVAGKSFLLSLINDVTESKRIEKALSESQQIITGIINTIPVRVFWKDKNLYYMGCNKFFAQDAGFTDPKEIIGKDDYQMAWSSQAELYRNDDLSVIKSGVPKLNIEEPQNTPEGKIITLLTSKIPLRNDSGKIIGILGTYIDITERKQIEQLLETEKEELNVTLRNIREGVISTNSDDNIILVNKAITDITGWSKDELKSKSIVEFFEIMLADFTSLAGKSKLSTIFGMNENNQSVTSEAMEITSKDGSKKIIFLNSAKVLNPEGDLKGYVYVLKDITEQVKTETQLQLSQKMESVGQLAAGIAHEINTPMQYIMDNTIFIKDSYNSLNEYIELTDKFISENNNPESESILSRRTELDLDFLLEEIPAAISQTQSGIERVSKIVKAMKDFSHPGQKEKIMADINHGINVTSTISKNEWKYYADLVLNLDESIPAVYCNIDEVNQVILNMIVNAAHAIQEKMNKTGNKEKGKIEVSTLSENDFVIISIGDTGNGIPPEIKERIFDPFFTTKEVGKGTGQGLAIAHNIIVKNHCGTINVESVTGEGTTFKIKLPVNIQKK